jgi:2-polyprenyl-3-methyl-5-hydroxy-6-metoxy-1,4-benzoquinol methylase
MVVHNHNFEMILTQNKVLWDHYHIDASHRGDLVAHVLSQVKNLHAARILDVGCGNGEIAARLASHGALVKAIDTDRKSMPPVKENVQFKCIEAEELAESPATYDAIVLCDVLEHLSQPSLVLRKLNSYLKKDGVLYLSTPNKYSPLNILSDPHYSLPGIALFNRTQVKKIISDYLQWMDRGKTDYAQLFSFDRLKKLLGKSDFSWHFINTRVVEFALTSPQAVWNRPWHLHMMQIIIKLHLQYFFRKLINDQPMLFNRWLNPTWYILAQRVNE